MGEVDVTMRGLSGLMGLGALGQASSRGLTPAPHGDTWKEIREGYGSDVIRNALCWKFSNKCTCAETSPADRSEAENIYQNALNNRLDWYAREQRAGGDLARFPYYQTHAYVEDTMAFYNAAGCLAATGKATPTTCNQWGLSPDGRECFALRVLERLDDDLYAQVLVHSRTLTDALQEMAKRIIIWGPDNRPRRPTLTEMSDADDTFGNLVLGTTAAITAGVVLWGVGETVGVFLPEDARKILDETLSPVNIFKHATSGSQATLTDQAIANQKLYAQVQAEQAAERKRAEQEALSKLFDQGGAQGGSTSRVPIIIGGVTVAALLAIMLLR